MTVPIENLTTPVEVGQTLNKYRVVDIKVDANKEEIYVLVERGYMDGADFKVYDKPGYRFDNAEGNTDYTDIMESTDPLLTAVNAKLPL
jgi:hypothetical protein